VPTGLGRCQLLLCGSGNGLCLLDWRRLLCCLSGLTELNGNAWSRNRRAAVQATLERIACRKATPQMDLRSAVVRVRKDFGCPW
jgi:hypothetical protein